MKNSLHFSCMFCLLYCRLCPLFKLMAYTTGLPGRGRERMPCSCGVVSNRAKKARKFSFDFYFKKNHFDNIFFTRSIERFVRFSGISPTEFRQCPFSSGISKFFKIPLKDRQYCRISIIVEIQYELGQ